MKNTLSELLTALIISFKFLLFMTFLLGIIYPLLMTGVSQIFFPSEAQGDLVTVKGKIKGSTLIAQGFTKDEYFWPRPSAINYNSLPSGGSNLSQISADLKKNFEERKKLLKASHLDQTQDPPQDLLFTSASGLDPHISPEAAQYQLQRVAKARGLSIEQINLFIQQATNDRQFGFLGEPSVNVLKLNLALDNAKNN